MFGSTQGNTQVYSPFGSYIVEQHDDCQLQQYIDNLPRPDLRLGKQHPLYEAKSDLRQAA